MRYLLLVVLSVSLGATATDGGILLTDDEAREYMNLRDVQVPLLKAEVEALKLELSASAMDIQSCADELAWCESWRDKPLNRPGVNIVIGGLAATAICAAAR